MIQEKNINNCFCENQSHGQSQVGSFFEVLQEVKEQVDAHCFSSSDRQQADEICLMIAEVYKLPPETPIQIAGAKLPAEMVQEIYHRLDHEHILLVMEKYGKAAYIINHKKTYLRTALYNSVFEIEAHYTNQVKHDFGY